MSPSQLRSELLLLPNDAIRMGSLLVRRALLSRLFGPAFNTPSW
jgi:hypothetical protein